MDITVTSGRRGAVHDVMIHLSDTMNDLNLINLMDGLAAAVDGSQPLTVQRLAMQALYEAMSQSVALTRWHPGDDHVHITRQEGHVMKRGRKQAPVEVQLSYPTTNQPNEKTDETGRYVKLSVVDRASGQLLVSLELSPSQWTRLLAGEGMYVNDAQISAYPHRLGKRHVHQQLESWRIADGRLDGLYGDARDTYLEEQRVLAEKTSGYEVVTIGKHNWGVEIIGHAWVEPDEEA